MPRPEEAQGAVILDPGLAGVPAIGQAGLGQHEVDVRQRLHGRADLLRGRAHPGGELAQDPIHLRLRLALQSADGVVLLHDRQRFEKESVTAPRLVLDDAGEMRAVAGEDGDHVAIVPEGDHRLRDDRQDLPIRQERLQSLPRRLARLSRLGAQPREVGARLVRHTPVRQDRAPDLSIERRRRAQTIRQGGQSAEVRAGLPQMAADLLRGLERVGDGEQVQGPQAGPGDPGARQGFSDVPRLREPRHRSLGEERAPLPCLGKPLHDQERIGRRRERPGPLDAEDGGRLGRQALQNGRKFQDAHRVGIHGTHA